MNSYFISYEIVDFFGNKVGTGYQTFKTGEGYSDFDGMLKICETRAKDTSGKQDISIHIVVFVKTS